MKGILAGAAVGALALLAYQTFQVHQLRGETAELRAASDSTATEMRQAFADYRSQTNARFDSLQDELDRAEAARVAEAAEVDATLAGLYEAVPVQVRPVVARLEARIDAERAGHAREKELIEEKVDDRQELVDRADAAVWAAEAAYRAELALRQKVEQQLEAQAGTKILGVDAGKVAELGLTALVVFVASR